jgi:hypothetical protein
VSVGEVNNTFIRNREGDSKPWTYLMLAFESPRSVDLSIYGGSLDHLERDK